MIVYSVEQLKGVIEGAMLASKMSEAMRSGAIFPFLILMLLYALAWFSVQYNAGKKSIQSVFLYLVASSFIMFMVLKDGNYTIILDPLYAKKGGNYVDIPSSPVTVDLKSADIKEEMKKVPDYRGDDVPSSPKGEIIVQGVPLIFDIFAFVDKVADSLYNLAFSLDSHNIADSMEKQKVCWNPEYMTKRALSHALIDINESVDKIDPSCVGDTLMRYIAVLNGYKGRESFLDYFKSEGKVMDDYIKSLRSISDAELEGNLLYVWSMVDPYIEGAVSVDSEIMDGTWMASIGEGGGGSGSGCSAYKDNDTIYQMIAAGVNKVVRECKELYRGDDLSIAEEQLKTTIGLFFTSPEGVRVVREFSDVVLVSTSELLHKITNTGQGGKKQISEVLKDIAFWSSQNLNFDIYAKMRVLMEIQGVALAFILGFSPLIIAGSLFPVGDSIINFKLIALTLIAYFLVKMWVPIVYIVYVLAWNKLFIDHILRGLGV